ncbi:MAG: oxidoreductase [Puniceicoccaceae bacterium]|nr:oxidoreductase [Puniceicoccaceae bacterium]|tara:strand:+ start:1121 stop:2002 length:882 start_codon:yes stop_codon:yes gene_type:complete
MKKIKIGWLGVGVMGYSMAMHFLNAGFPLSLYSRTRSKAHALEERGAQWKDNPASVAEDSDVIFSMLGYPDDVESVLLGENGVVDGIAPGTMMVDMTTSSPELATRIEFKMVEKKAWSMDAPVSGGDRGARDATLAIMCGGERKSFDQVLPLLRVVGKEIAWFGPAGSGQQAKMANQILIASTMVGTVEALLYGERANLDLEHLIKVLSKGAAGCWSLLNLAPRMLKEDWQPGFYIKHFIKDMKIALEDAERMGIVLPGLELAAQFYDEAKIQGLEEKGTQALLRVLRSMNQK